MIYIGIDPGQSGGLVSIVPKVGITATPMPATERDVWEWFDAYNQTTEDCYADVIAMIERVHSFPGQGVASSFKFGMGYGGLRMALISSGIPFEEVTPRPWQKAMGITPRAKTESKSQFKNRLKAKAQQLFPKVSITLKTADALLIAEFCRRKHKGIL